MTEKKFVIKDDIIYFDGDVCSDFGECNVLALLNRQHEIIQGLKSDLDYFYRTYEIEERGLDIVAPMCTIGSPTPSRLELFKENKQLKSDKEHLMGCLIRFFGYDDEDIDYNLNRESNREYGKQYYSMKEETKKELEE